MTIASSSKYIFWGSFLIFFLGALWKVQPTESASGVGLDKIAHVLVFFWMTYYGIRTYSKWVYCVLVGLCFYGLIIELLQGLTGWRMADGEDMLANLAGIGLGWTITMRCHPMENEK